MPSRAALSAILTDPLASWAPNAFFAADLINNRCKLGGRYVGGLTNLPGVSITRATSAYYTDSRGQLSLFASGAARIGDRGLLVEGAAQNLCLQSADFSTTWVRSGVLAFGSGSTVNAIAAPDGTTTADFICEDTTTAAHDVRQSVTTTAAAHTFSVFLKAGTRTFALLYHSTTNVGTVFNLSTGATAGNADVGAPTSASITALANGWYRCSITVNATAAANSFRVYIMTDATTYTYTGDGSSGLYLWGAQLETGVATSYIPTTAGSATRNADVISVGSVTGLTYANGVTMFAEFERAADTGSTEAILAIDNNVSINDEALLYVGSGDVGRLYTANVGVQANLVGAAWAQGATRKIAGRVTTDNVQMAVDGTLATADTSATNPSTPTVIRLGGRVGATNIAHGYIRRLAIFGTAYSDAQLQSLTS